MEGRGSRRKGGRKEGVEGREGGKGYEEKGEREREKK